MDKRKRLNSVDSGPDIEEMDDRPPSSMSVEKDMVDTEEKVDIESPVTPAPFMRPPRSSPSPFLSSQRPPVKAEVDDSRSLVSPLVSSATSPRPSTDSREAVAKLMSPPVSSSTGVSSSSSGNIPILPHDSNLASAHPPCLSPYSGAVPPHSSSLSYPPYLYYSSLMHPLYLGRHPQLPLPSLPSPSATSVLDKARDLYSYPYFRHHSNHPSSLLSGPPRPIPVHTYSYALPHQVPANL